MRGPLLPLTAAVALALLASACAGSREAAPTPPTTERGSTEQAGEAPDDDVSVGDDELNVSITGWRTDVTRHTVPLSEFKSGGPPKDGIPALDDPRFVPVEEAGSWLSPREPLIEVEVAGEVRGYPLQVLIWHEIANDTVGGVPVAVTFCPLCNTTIVFDRRLEGRVLDFGTTGNLRNSDLVMYDRQTESWWQQFSGDAVVGELAGKRLRKVPARIIAWEEFEGTHPGAPVLSRDTGHDRPYGTNPYVGYDSVDSPPFFGAANSDDDRLPPKERVVYVERGKEVAAISFSFLEREREVELDVGGENLTVVWIPGAGSALDDDSIADGRGVGSAEVRAGSGELVAFDTPFWFAVAAFRPDVRVVTGTVRD